MPESPHTPELRAMVSQESLDGIGSYCFLAEKYNIGTRALRKWKNRQQAAERVGAPKV